MKARATIAAAAVALATLATLTVPITHYAVWNVSASVPTGLYAIRGRASLHVGERVAIEPPVPLRSLLAERHYLPAGVPLLKRVAAVSGQRVCRFGHGVTIDSRFAGVARARDSHGRPLPAWAGCHTLHTGELFVMNLAAPDSFDGRYFGKLRVSNVIGRAAPVWTDEAGDGRHVWFADPRQFDRPQPPAGD
ncbi:S26 family signal peptidase [Novosphingobium jiangmenense]|uniref:S26 family signal peptidase n=1 Tax=Novosphingobium jiangmenense TaxID=2791981 RepID=A0ABS0HHG0_9SPHN|nr:S26 family signal peptidase [Novosphingobium jiangmenense]MBF9151698.1 S26 family signal peptidase [Novosphingobium jiangmenense]